MKRFPHILKPCLSGAAPKGMVCFDTETYTSKETPTEKQQTLKLWTAVYYRHKPGIYTDIEQWTHGTTTAQLAQFLISCIRKKSCLYVFSANIWFDLRVSQLFTYLIDNHWHVKSYFSRGKAFQLVHRRDTRTIRFLNIQNILPVSVAKLGEIIGLPKLEVDFKKVSDKKLLEYCYRDTEIIYKSMLHWFDFIKHHDLGTFGITLPTQAFNAYRHRFMPYQIFIHDNVKCLALERRAYFGGRCECWFIGKRTGKPIYYVDINSMYPYIMKKNRLPHKLIGFKYEISVEEALANAKKHCIVADCELETTQPIYPVRIKNKVVYPVGKFETSLCTGSFVRAVKLGHVKRITLIARYVGNYIFTDWVNEMYANRLKYNRAKNKVYEELSKKLLNSLYGKFGQKSDELINELFDQTVAFTSERMYNNVIGKWVTVTHLGDYEKVCIEGVNEGAQSFPAISAHVTDYARLYLWDMIVKAGKQNVYYMDTDCLFVNQAGYDRLKSRMHKTRLGAFKLEATANRLVIHGPKDYVIGKKKRIKGVSHKATEILPGTYSFDIFPGIRGELRPTMSKTYAIRKIIKVLKRDYDKGVVTASGRVQPFCLPLV